MDNSDLEWICVSCSVFCINDMYGFIKEEEKLFQKNIDLSI